MGGGGVLQLSSKHKTEQHSLFGGERGADPAWPACRPLSAPATCGSPLPATDLRRLALPPTAAADPSTHPHTHAHTSPPLPSPSGTYNPILGFAGEECPSCIADIRPTATEGPQFTSYAGAEWCSVEALDLQCDDVLLCECAAAARWRGGGGGEGLVCAGQGSRGGKRGGPPG